MRFSRTCYDKSHRCPGYAGGGVKSSRSNKHDCNGYITADRPWDGKDDTYPGHPSEKKWHFGRCNRCNVITWPVITRWLDPGWWGWVISWKRQALEDWLYDWGWKN